MKPCKDNHPVLVTDEGVHEESLLNEPLPLRILILEIPIVVIGNNNPIFGIGHFNYVAIIIADHSLPFHFAGWGVHKDWLLFKLFENVLIWKQKGNREESQHLAGLQHIP